MGKKEPLTKQVPKRYDGTAPAATPTKQESHIGKFLSFCERKLVPSEEQGITLTSEEKIAVKAKTRKQFLESNLLKEYQQLEKKYNALLTIATELKQSLNKATEELRPKIEELYEELVRLNQPGAEGGQQIVDQLNAQFEKLKQTLEYIEENNVKISHDLWLRTQYDYTSNTLGLEYIPPTHEQLCECINQLTEKIELYKKQMEVLSTQIPECYKLLRIINDQTKTTVLAAEHQRLEKQVEQLNKLFDERFELLVQKLSSETTSIKETLVAVDTAHQHLVDSNQTDASFLNRLSSTFSKGKDTTDTKNSCCSKEREQDLANLRLQIDQLKQNMTVPELLQKHSDNPFVKTVLVEIETRKTKTFQELSAKTEEITRLQEELAQLKSQHAELQTLNSSSKEIMTRLFPLVRKQIGELNLKIEQRKLFGQAEKGESVESNEQKIETIPPSELEKALAECKKTLTAVDTAHKHLVNSNQKEPSFLTRFSSTSSKEKDTPNTKKSCIEKTQDLANLRLQIDQLKQSMTVLEATCEQKLQQLREESKSRKTKEEFDSELESMAQTHYAMEKDLCRQLYEKEEQIKREKEAQQKLKEVISTIQTRLELDAELTEQTENTNLQEDAEETEEERLKEKALPNLILEIQRILEPIHKFDQKNTNPTEQKEDDDEPDSHFEEEELPETAELTREEEGKKEVNKIILLETKLKTKVNNITFLLAELKELEQKYEQIEQLNSKLQQDLERKEDERFKIQEVLLKEKGDFQEISKETNKKLKGQAQTITTLEKENEEKQRKIDQQTRNIQYQQIDSQRTISQLNQQIRIKKTEINKLKKECTELRQQLEQQTQENAELKGQLEQQKREELGQLQEENATLKKDNTALQKQIQERTTDIDSKIADGLKILSIKLSNLQEKDPKKQPLYSLIKSIKLSTIQGDTTIQEQERKKFALKAIKKTLEFLNSDQNEEAINKYNQEIGKLKTQNDEFNKETRKNMIKLAIAAGICFATVVLSPFAFVFCACAGHTFYRLHKEDVPKHMQKVSKQRARLVQS